jgi:TPR repeat protein
MKLKRILAVFILVSNFAAPVAAGPLEDARTAFRKRDYATALRLLQPLANQGNAVAQFSIGSTYDHGQCAPQSYVEAVKWWHLAAEQGYAAVQISLEGWLEDYAEALKWLLPAANKGNGDAQFIIGGMYANGQGVPQDYVRARTRLPYAKIAGAVELVRPVDQLEPERMS